MKKVILTFVILVAFNITSCQKNDPIKTIPEISILGEWKQYSRTNSSGVETILTSKCPDELSIFKKEIAIVDYLEVKEPCIGFDITSVTYSISDNIMTITDNGVSETAEILTLTEDILRIKSSNNVINHYTRIPL